MEVQWTGTLRHTLGYNVTFWRNLCRGVLQKKTLVHAARSHKKIYYPPFLSNCVSQGVLHIVQSYRMLAYSAEKRLEFVDSNSWS